MKKVFTLFFIILAISILSVGFLCVEASAASTYTISYYGNGVSGAPTSQIKTEKTAIRLSSMSSNNYVFLGWATTPYGEIAYKGGASYNTDQDISLYAQWGNHCHYCDDTGYTTKGEYKKVKCTTCNSFSFVQTYYWHCDDCNSTYVHETKGCMDCGSNRLTRYIDCPDCIDGYHNEWVTTQIMCSECYGDGYHKRAQVNAPQPKLESKTSTSVTLVAFEGVDYSANGESWQESNVFNNLTPGTKYTFYMRYRANSIHTVGAAGTALCVNTDSINHNHTYSSWSQTKTPTCTTKGTALRTCSTCQNVETKDVEATGHSMGAWTQTSAPKCAEKGQETRSCSRCSHKETRDVNALGHAFSNPTITKQPTCTETGIESGTCTRCSQTTTNTIPAKGHTYDSVVVTKEATETEAGSKTLTCSVCGETKIEEIPVIGTEPKTEEIPETSTTVPATTTASPIEEEKETSVVAVVVISIASTVAVIAAGAAAWYFLIFKKKV